MHQPLNDDGEPEPPFAALQPAIEHALVCIVNTVAGPDTARYVDEFLEDFSEQVKIPRWRDYE